MFNLYSRKSKNLNNFKLKERKKKPFVMGDKKVKLFFFFFLLHLSKKVKYRIGDVVSTYPTTKMEIIGNIINEIFEKKFPGQDIQAFGEYIIVKGKMKNLLEEKWDEKTSLKVREKSINDYDELIIQFPPPTGKKCFKLII